MKEYPELFPTGGDFLEQLFCVSGNGYVWKDGVLTESWDDKGCKMLVHPNDADKPYIKSLLGVGADECNNHPILQSIPEIPDEKFLPKSKLLYPISADDAKASTMPEWVDVHYIAAAMIFLKHLLDYPNILRPSDDGGIVEDQLDNVKRTIGLGIRIIEARGMQEDFFRSLSEFKGEMSVFTEFSREHVGAEIRLAQMELEILKAERDLEDLRSPGLRGKKRDFGPGDLN